MRAAVILSGCGVFDGSEIHEAVSLLMHLSRAGVEAECFAPDIEQRHVVDHLAGEVAQESRWVLVEAARIARGKVQPLDKLDPAGYDALFVPGGFGAAKNLCSFAFDGAACGVEPSVERALNGFHGAGKPIGMCCIAPVIAARVFEGARITLGGAGEAPEAAEAMGATHVVRPVDEIEVDAERKLVTTPAYMYDAAIHEVDAGIGKMVAKVLALAE